MATTYCYVVIILNTTLPHNLIIDKLLYIIERYFQKEGSPYLTCLSEKSFFLRTAETNIFSKCNALTFLFDNIFQRFGTKYYRQVVGRPMCTNFACLVADLFIFGYNQRVFMMPVSDEKLAYIIYAFYLTFRHFDDILNINNTRFNNLVSQKIYTLQNFNSMKQIPLIQRPRF